MLSTKQIIQAHMDEILDKSLEAEYKYFRKDFDTMLETIDYQLGLKYKTRSINDLLHCTSARISARRTVLRKIQLLLRNTKITKASKMILWFLLSEYLEDIKLLKLDLEEYRYY